ncbi:MAG TPA: glycosyltransferase [Bryobacteraceae bacterium]|jgi:glycosyltransferase involved in cell wall biosynthesis
MTVAVVIEHRYHRTPDGAIWTSSFFGYSFWLRYLEVFDKVKVVARVRDAAEAPAHWKRADGDGVTFAPIPYYVGPLQYLLKMRRVDRAVCQAIGPEDAIVLRLDSQLAASIDRGLRKLNRPYGVELGSDPYDLFAPGSFDHPLRRLFRWWFTHKLRLQCSGAAAVAYVTQNALRKRYPASSGRYSTHYSSIELPARALAQSARRFDPAKPLILATVTLLDQPGKRVDKLIEATAALRSEGRSVRLIVVGDGRLRPELEALAARLGASDAVDFVGLVPSGEAVWKQLDRADLFVTASRSEGLPRAAIEAMARALPVIGSNIAGFSEILPPENLVPVGDLPALISKIQEVASSPERMFAMSARNLEKARDYLDTIVRARRIEMFEELRRQTEAWGSRSERIQMALVNTEPRSWDFWRGQGTFMRARGIDSHCVSSDGDLLHRFGRSEEVTVHAVEITRTIAPWRDFIAVLRLATLFRRLRIQIVDGNTSKAGLLAMAAGWLARVPVRIYHNHGMALSSATGARRLLLWACERASCALAHRALYVSPSVRDAAIQEGVCPRSKAAAILSINGLDALQQFNPATLPPGSRATVRERHGISLNAPVLGYVGRLFLVKGIVPLIEAWRILSMRYPDLHMLVAGDFDPREPLPEDFASVLKKDSRIHLVGYVDNTAPIFDAMDISILPSFHEGLGYVLIEASAMERPVIGTRIPGIVDAVNDDETGALIEPGRPDEIARAVSRYLDDPELRRLHGSAGRRMVLEKFSQQRVWTELHQCYARLLDAKGISHRPRLQEAPNEAFERAGTL